MSRQTHNQSIVFAIYPNAGGFGYVYMKDPRTLLDYGTVRIHPVSNTKILGRIKKELAHLRPTVLLIQNGQGKSSRTGRRVRRLIKRIVKYAERANLDVAQYSRDDIRNVFTQFGVKTKHEISQLLITEFTELATIAPKKRKLWTSEDRYMAIFDALS